MLIVSGDILAKSSSLPGLLDLSPEHARRSGKEPGCLAHAVHQGAEDPLRLVFVMQY